MQTFLPTGQVGETTLQLFLFKKKLAEGDERRITTLSHGLTFRGYDNKYLYPLSTGVDKVKVTTLHMELRR